MDLNQFHESDQFMAFKEALCITNCLYMMQSAFAEGDYKQARIAAENVARSFKSLEDMQRRKAHQEKLQNILNEVQKQGIGITIIKRGIKS